MADNSSDFALPSFVPLEPAAAPVDTYVKPATPGRSNLRTSQQVSRPLIVACAFYAGAAENHYDRWRRGQLSNDEFASNLSREWAAWPDPFRGGQSHYGGDGINRAGRTLAQVRDAFYGSFE